MYILLFRNNIGDVIFLPLRRLALKVKVYCCNVFTDNNRKEKHVINI